MSNAAEAFGLCAAIAVLYQLTAGGSERHERTRCLCSSVRNRKAPTSLGERLDQLPPAELLRRNRRGGGARGSRSGDVAGLHKQADQVALVHQLPQHRHAALRVPARTQQLDDGAHTSLGRLRAMLDNVWRGKERQELQRQVRFAGVASDDKGHVDGLAVDVQAALRLLLASAAADELEVSIPRPHRMLDKVIKKVEGQLRVRPPDQGDGLEDGKIHRRAGFQRAGLPAHLVRMLRPAAKHPLVRQVDDAHEVVHRVRDGLRLRVLSPGISLQTHQSLPQVVRLDSSGAQVREGRQRPRLRQMTIQTTLGHKIVRREVPKRT
eukprot:scaffold10_cov257-Pinguiococcus_pyrenoidosus.AAC.6